VCGGSNFAVPPDAALMRFQIAQDNGTQVMGWVLPDNPASVSRVRVFFGDTFQTTVEASILAKHVKDQGLHNTGFVGFTITEKNCKGVVDARDLRVYDDETNLLIYQRRPSHPVVEQKLFRLETQLLRATPLNDLLIPRFHMAYTGLENLPQETTKSVVGIQFTTSLYVTGALQVRAIEDKLREGGCKTAILLRDPYEELAERLLILRWAATPQGASSSAHLGRGSQNAIDALRDAPLDTPGNVEAVLGRLNENAERALFDTTTRLLAVKNWDEPLDSHSVGAALEALSHFEIVGVRSDLRGFLDVLEAVCNAEEQLPEVKLELYPSVRKLTDLIRPIQSVSARISRDLELYQAAFRALGVAAAEASGESRDGRRVAAR
jgi:hypothetical protein